MRPINRGTVPAHITASGFEQQVTAESYGFYMGELITRIGEYCSYCEIPMGANLAIEHVLPKSVYPNAETDWNNFVLSCTNCNSRKGNRIQSRANIYWPDDTNISIAQTGFNTFTMFEYYAGQADGDDVVLVRYREGSTADQNAVENTIDMVKLNAYKSPRNDTKMSDRRVWNRTRTWKMASSMADTLAGYYAPYANTGNDVLAAQQTANDPAIQALQRQIVAAALAAGFWSAWMTVFAARTFINQDVRNALLQELFINTFPGTRF